MMKFRMIDRIVAYQPRRFIRGVKAVSFEEYRLKSPLGDEPTLPESLIMESLFQLGNWLIMLSSDFSQMGLLVRTQEVRFLDRIRPGQSLLAEARVRSFRKDGVLFDGRALVDGDLVTTGTGCLAAPAPLADHYDPDDMRVLFSEIYRPDDRCAGPPEPWRR